MIEEALEKDGVIADSYEFAQAKGRHHAHEIIPSIKSLEAGNKVITSARSMKTWALTEEAESYAQRGSPEAQIWTAVPAEGIDQKALLEKVPNGNIGFAQAMKNKVCRSCCSLYVYYRTHPFQSSFLVAEVGEVCTQGTCRACTR